MAKPISLWELARHFSAWTSVNGFPHVVLTHNNCIRLCWFLIVFGALFAGIFQTIALMVTYFGFAVNIDTRTQFGPLAFPSVTICNANPWKVSKAAGTPLQSLINAYNHPGPSARFGLPWPSSEQRLIRARDWMWQMGERLGQMASQNGSQIAYSFPELFIECHYDQIACNESNFMDFFDVYYGHCFTFNQNGSLNSTVAGPRHGLQLLLRVESAEYLPWTTAHGAVVFTDQANATPYTDSYGYFARPGFATRFGIQFHRRTKLPKPFNNCTDSTQEVSSQPIYYSGDYEIDACMRSCMQDRIVFLCGCYSPLFNRSLNSSNPAVTLSCLDSPNPNSAIDCVNGVVNFHNSTEWNPYHSCDCPFSCDQNYYKISVSEAKWPARNYIPAECAKNKSWPGKGLQQENCREWYARETARVEVYHQRISTISVQERQAYQVIEFIADAGGALGLWLGMSSISMLEVFIFLCMALAYCCTSPSRKRKWKRAAQIRPEFGVVEMKNGGKRREKIGI